MEKHRIIWRGIAIEITFNPEMFGITEHIELRAENHAPLPVTETGYRSCFLEPGSVAAQGGAVAFVQVWLDHEAAQTGWNETQLTLF